mgnify:CR=1 FL=1
MKLISPSRVKSGDIILVGDEEYKVILNASKQIVVQKGGQAPVKLSSITDFDYDRSLVMVVCESASNQPSLTEQLRRQLRQQELTKSLRAQVEAQEEEGYDEDNDYDEEDDCCEGECNYCWEEDEEPECHPIQAGTLTAPLTPSPEQAIQAALNASLKAKKALKEATTASLRAQVAQQQAASIDVDDIYDTIEETVEDLNETKHDVFLVKDSVESLQENVHHLYRGVETLDGEVADLSYRVHVLEEKQKQEEIQMNLQQQLNEKLALQKKFNEALKKNKKGGMNMKGLFEGIKAQFGKVEGKFAFSPMTGGLAIRKEGTNEYVVFDGQQITDVKGLVLNFDVPAFMLPASEDQIKKGDIVRNGDDFIFVTNVADGYVEGVNAEKRTRASVLPTKHVFFAKPFYTVVRTLDAAGKQGFDPMLLLALTKGNKDDILPFLLAAGGLQGKQVDPTLLMLLSDNMDDLLPFLFLQQGGFTQQGFNPLLLLAMKDGGKKDLLPLILAMQGGQINPMMLLALDGDIDVTTLALMGGFGDGFNLFGVQAQQPKKPEQK